METYEDYAERMSAPDDTLPVRLATYTLRIMGPEGWPGFPDALTTLGSTLSEVEENVSDLLPEGFYCKVDEGD